MSQVDDGDFSSLLDVNKIMLMIFASVLHTGLCIGFCAFQEYFFAGLTQCVPEMEIGATDCHELLCLLLI